MSFPAGDRPFDCNDTERFCYAYLDGEFDASERQLVEKHLAACATCEGKMQEAATFRSMVRLHVRPGPRAPEGLRARIAAGLDGEQRQQSRQGAIDLARRAWPSVAMGLTAAASLVLLFGQVSPSAHSVIDAAVAMHARSLPLEVATTDMSTLQPLFRHLDFAVQPPSFPRQQMALMGGRLSHLGTRDAAYLEYQMDHGGSMATSPFACGPGRRMSLFVVADPDRELRIVGTDMARVANHEVLLTTLRGYNVAVWRSNEIVYSMVTDLGRAETLDLLAGGEAR
jgi:anti-sigma factor RsiW